MRSAGARSSSAATDGRFHGFVGQIRAFLGQRSIDRIGRGTVIAGAPHVENDGFIQMGEDCHLSSHPVQSHLLAMPDARLLIGDRVFISYGAAISTRCSIQIGDDTRIGPFCLILDNDFHMVGDRDSPGGLAPIEIGRKVTLGARVTVLRGARIGDGACVMSGSTVAGVVAAGSVVTGVPARVKGNDTARVLGRSVASIVMRVFQLTTFPSPLEGPAQIPGWNDVGAIRLLLALEEAFDVLLSEEQIQAARSVADLARLVTAVREGNLHGPTIPGQS